MNHLVPKSLLEKMAEWRKAAKAWKPWPYQGIGLKVTLEDSFSGLLLDPGMGKTSISLAAIKILLQKKLIKRALIFAPLRAVYEVWPAEASDWTDFHSLGIAILHGPRKEAILRALKPEHQICLINPEGADWLFAKKERIKLLDADGLWVDESSKWKKSTTVRFHALRPYLIKFKCRHILTGSPRPRHYLDLFGQIYILDRGATLGSYVTHYRNNFFFPTGYQMREWEPLPGSPEKINKLVAPLVFRLEAKDYLKLPEVPPDKIHRIDLPAKVRVEYDKIEDSLMSTLFTEPLVHSASARSKCCQIANGAVYTDAPGEDFHKVQRPVKVVHTAKVEALADLVDELQGEPLLVGIGYHHDVSAIRAMIGKNTPCINSATTRTQAAKFIEDWNKGKISVLLGHPASMGHGLNLQGCGCRHVAYFDIPDDYDNYDQFFRRVWRQGNKSQFVFRHHFVTRATVDEAKIINLKHKGSGQRDFLAAMKEYSKLRQRGKK